MHVEKGYSVVIGMQSVLNKWQLSAVLFLHR